MWTLRVTKDCLSAKRNKILCALCAFAVQKQKDASLYVILLVIVISIDHDFDPVTGPWYINLESSCRHVPTKRMRRY